ncbi:hypothetical protein MRX96_041154 [Rhipicephalus microplus]
MAPASTNSMAHCRPGQWIKPSVCLHSREYFCSITNFKEIEAKAPEVPCLADTTAEYRPGTPRNIAPSRPRVASYSVQGIRKQRLRILLCTSKSGL